MWPMQGDAEAAYYSNVTIYPVVTKVARIPSIKNGDFATDSKKTTLLAYLGLFRTILDYFELGRTIHPYVVKALIFNV